MEEDKLSGVATRIVSEPFEGPETIGELLAVTNEGFAARFVRESDNWFPLSCFGLADVFGPVVDVRSITSKLIIRSSTKGIPLPCASSLGTMLLR